jgi:hypothetical protein
MNTSLLSRLLKRNCYTWLIFGAAFLLISCNTAGRDTPVNGATVKVLNINPLLILIGLYYILSQASAFLIAKLVKPAFDPFIALIHATVRVGFIAAILSVTIHGILLWLANNYLWHWLPDFRSPLIVIIGAFVYPLLACLAASATLEAH